MMLSVLIPARNEEFLARTVQDLLENIQDDTEIIVGLDGEWANPQIPQNERVIVFYSPVSIGQRAMTNQLCRLARGKYVMKVDAHCAFRPGFDTSMLKAYKKIATICPCDPEKVLMVPTMRNLHAFNWVCECGYSHYQDKGSKCLTCGKEMKKDVVWIAKSRPESRSYRFDSEPHFQYFNEYTKRKEYIEQAEKYKLTETMSIQGSCFMLTRKMYWKLNICDESYGSWGSQGIEVACKFWFSGGKVVVNHRTWYAHMFRTKPANGFGFPYKMDQNKAQEAKKRAKEIFFNSKDGVHSMKWLLEKFWPVPGWSQEELDKL